MSLYPDKETSVIAMDTRDRLIRLEAEFEAHERRFEDYQKKAEESFQKMSEIHDRIMKMDGGFWVMMTFSGIFGAVVALLVQGTHLFKWLKG